MSNYDLDDVCDRLDNIEEAIKSNEAAIENKSFGNGWWIGPLIVILVTIWVPDAWHSSLRYSIQYQVGEDQIIRHDQPQDCDFLKAPLGKKGCHYDRQVTTVRVGTNQWGGHAISYDEGKTWTHTAKNQLGDPIVSHDNGQTWSTEYVPVITQTTVDVSWQKVED